MWKVYDIPHQQTGEVSVALNCEILVGTPAAVIKHGHYFKTRKKRCETVCFWHVKQRVDVSVSLSNVRPIQTNVKILGHTKLGVFFGSYEMHFQTSHKFSKVAATPVSICALWYTHVFSRTNKNILVVVCETGWKNGKCRSVF